MVADTIPAGVHNSYIVGNPSPSMAGGANDNVRTHSHIDELLQGYAELPSFKDTGVVCYPCCICAVDALDKPLFLDYSDKMGRATVNLRDGVPFSIVYNWSIDAIESLKAVAESSGTPMGKSLIASLEHPEISNGKFSHVEPAVNEDDLYHLLRTHVRYAHRDYNSTRLMTPFEKVEETGDTHESGIVGAVVKGAMARARDTCGRVYLHSTATVYVNDKWDCIGYDDCLMRLSAAQRGKNHDVSVTITPYARAIAMRRLMESVTVPGVMLANILAREPERSGKIRANVLSDQESLGQLLKHLVSH
jgi:hypothetical protein